ncbi:MAG: DNA-3-methyladenine glycosylase [Chloroflexota bacterium]|nr:DNA-3-methyladenine glycosylase [Chloroflexota bacterium]
MTTRCQWAQDPQFHNYHDTEWGVPVHEDRQHFEFLVLEGAQAGLSWATILKRRAAYRQAFTNFDPQIVARFSDEDYERLLKDAGIIRNRLKIRSAINNAQRFLEVQQEFGSFDAYIWQFVDNQPIVNTWERMEQIPAVTAESELLSKDLKARGFTFVGPTIIYAHMQATGLVNDHEVACFRYSQVQNL